MLLAHLHAVAPSLYTGAENLANYSEGAVVWSIVRRLVVTVLFLFYLEGLRSHRTEGMLKMITCAPRQFICVARYGPLFNSQTFFSQHVNVLALRPSRNDVAGWEDLFLSGTL